MSEFSLGVLFGVCAIVFGLILLGRPKDRQ